MLLIPINVAPRLAQAFIDYMRSQNIILSLQQQQNQLMLALEQEDHLVTVERELAIFLQNPLDKRYQAASWQQHQPNKNPFIYPSHSYWQMIQAHAGIMTLAVAAISIVIFLLMQIVGVASVMTLLAYPANVQQDWQVWRWFSHALLHFSLLHLLFNLLWWWYLAGQVEKQQGKGKLLTITLIAALLTGWVQFHFSGPAFGGLSGVVYALMGYVWLLGKLHPDSQLALPNALMIFSLLWLIAGYANLFGLAIANAAHTTGLVIGLLMALQDRYRPQALSR